MSERPTLHVFGDEAVRFYWKPEISDSLNDAVIAWADAIRSRFKNQIEDITIGYNEISVHFPNLEETQKFLKEYTEESIDVEQEESRVERSHLFIPVCYDPAFALDMNSYAEVKGFAPEEIIALHTQPEYRVYFLGFLPGFPYLGGMNEKLEHARLDKPRRQVPAGAVGIAGKQTGIYPTESPGGWNIIGQTPLSLFDPQDATPTLLKSSDRLSFYSISPAEFERIRDEVMLKNMIEIRSFCQKKQNEKQ